MTRATRIFIGLFACALFSGPSKAVAQSFCGQFDLTQIKNSEIMDQLFLADFRRGIKRTTACGLFSGENLPMCSSCSDRPSPQMMGRLRVAMGTKKHLAWHSNWHKIRGASGLNENTLEKLRETGWIPADATAESMKPHLAGGSLHGEDFLYMHRVMLKMAQLELAFAGDPCLAPWERPPVSVDDPVWPVRRSLQDPEARAKAEESLAIYGEQWKRLMDPAFLRSVKTLNRLGAEVEPLLHQNLHLFYRSEGGCSPESEREGYCDDLLPPATSPLNPYFWKIHGMLDGLIGAWLKTHGYAQIDVSCAGQTSCYQWRGTWVGQYPREK